MDRGGSQGNSRVVREFRQMTLSEGAKAMEGARGGRQRPLEIERDFACSRLEKQLLASAYESAVPLIRRSAGCQTAEEGNSRQLDHSRHSNRAKGE